MTDVPVHAAVAVVAVVVAATVVDDLITVTIVQDVTAVAVDDDVIAVAVVCIGSDQLVRAFVGVAAVAAAVDVVIVVVVVLVLVVVVFLRGLVELLSHAQLHRQCEVERVSPGRGFESRSPYGHNFTIDLLLVLIS